jgi:hypothetical protein
MLPDTRNLARWNQNIYIRQVRVETVIHLAFIICAICRKIKDGLLNLLYNRSTAFSSLTLFSVRSTAWISQSSGFTPTCNLRQVRRFETPYIITQHDQDGLIAVIKLAATLFFPLYSHFFSKPSEIQNVIEPRCIKALSYSDQFLTRYNVFGRGCVLFCLAFHLPSHVDLLYFAHYKLWFCRI